MELFGYLLGTQAITIILCVVAFIKAKGQKGVRLLQAGVVECRCVDTTHLR